MAEADAPLLVERTDDDVVIATLRNGKVNALSNRVRAQALCSRCRYRPVRRLRRRG